MFNIMCVIGIIVTIATMIGDRAKSKPIPPDAKFDWDAYYADLANGMDKMTQLEKRRRGEYWTTKK